MVLKSKVALPLIHLVFKLLEFALMCVYVREKVMQQFLVVSEIYNISTLEITFDFELNLFGFPNCDILIISFLRIIITLTRFY